MKVSFKLKIIFLISFIFVLIVCFMFLKINVYGQTNTIKSAESNYDNLFQLVETYDLNLDDDQLQYIIDNCSEIIENTLNNTVDQFKKMRKSYLIQFSITEESLILMQSDLKNMNQNFDLINKNIDDFQSLKMNLIKSLDIYQSSIEDLLMLNSDCQNYPEMFAAGLKEMESRRKLVNFDMLKLLNFIDPELLDNLDDLQQFLIELESDSDD